jgi:hypothetical protein
MTKHLWTALAVALLLSLPSASQGASPKAEQPKTQVGDAWLYSVTANGHYLAKRRFTVAGKGEFRGQPALRISSELTEVRSPKVKEFLEDGEIFFTPKGAWLGESRGPGRSDYAEPPLPVTLWPLKVGKKWTATVSLYFELKDIPNEYNRFEVLSYGPLKVPAGTFDAFHVERRSHRTTMNYWYAPKVKNIIKYQGVDWRDDLNYVIELVDYKLNSADHGK